MEAPPVAVAARAASIVRRQEGEVAATVAPRLVASLGLGTSEWPCDEGVWGDARIDLPFLKEDSGIRDVPAGQAFTVDGGGLAAATVLAHFPGAVLLAG